MQIRRIELGEVSVGLVVGGPRVVDERGDVDAEGEEAGEEAGGGGVQRRRWGLSKPHVARRHRQVDYPAISRKNATHASRSRDRDLFQIRKFTSTFESMRAPLWCVVFIGVGLTESLMNI